VSEAFESGALDLDGFYFTGDGYRYRFKVEAKERFIALLRDRFNAGVMWKGQRLKWDTVIEEKTNELARYLNARTVNLDFAEPSPILERTDDRAVRDAVLHLTQKEASRRGIGKSTLHYLRKRAQDETYFTVYKGMRGRLRLDLNMPRHSQMSS